MIYPQTITLYQTDDQVYSPAEVALVNTFNTFLDALDGVRLKLLASKASSDLYSHTAPIAPMERPVTILPLTLFILTQRLEVIKVSPHKHTYVYLIADFSVRKTDVWRLQAYKRHQCVLWRS